MTEPVAYRVDSTIYNYLIDAEYAVREIEHLRSSIGMDNGLIRRPVSIEPLYTADQLRPRVKMTQAEFDELEKSLINAQFDYSELKKTIEIIPDIKWFVRSKESDINGYGWLSIIDKYQTPVYQYNNDKPLSSFVSFDTKEEAEKWTNPLTEAVQLPVEGE